MEFLVNTLMLLTVIQGVLIIIKGLISLKSRDGLQEFWGDIKEFTYSIGGVIYLYIISRDAFRNYLMGVGNIGMAILVLLWGGQ